MITTYRLWRAAVRALPGVLAVGLAAGCGSTTGPTPATIRASVHVLGSEESSGLKIVSSYTIDAATGRLSLVATQSTGIVGPYPRTAPDLLTADPQARFVYVATRAGVRSYSVDPVSGALTLVNEVPIEHVRSPRPEYPEGLTRLVATESYVYLLGGWYRFGSRTGYERMTLAVGAGGTLTSRGGQWLGLDGYGGTSMLRMIADPGAQILYQLRGAVAVRASQIQPDGTLRDISEAPLPENGYWRFSTMALVRGALLVSADGDLISLQLDRERGTLDARTYLPRAGGPVLPLGPTGLLVGNYRSFTTYDVGPAGELTFKQTLPDPERYYSVDDDGMAFDLSGRFFYSLRGSSVWAFAVGPDGQLSLLQVLGAPGMILRKLVITEPRA